MVGGKLAAYFRNKKRPMMMETKVEKKRTQRVGSDPFFRRVEGMRLMTTTTWMGGSKMAVQRRPVRTLPTGGRAEGSGDGGPVMGNSDYCRSRKRQPKKKMPPQIKESTMG